jgi:hypothetical protein
MSEWHHGQSSQHLHAVSVPPHRTSNRSIYIALAAVAAIVAITCAVIWEEAPRAQSAADKAPVISTAAPTAAAASATVPPRKPVEKSPPVAETMQRDGTYLVGRQIKTGTYTAPGADTGPCYWARLRDTSGEQAAVIAASYKHGQQVVTIRKGDRAFVTDGCGPWELMKP